MPIKTHKPRLLVVGANSKLARKLLSYHGKDYIVDGTTSEVNMRRNLTFNPYTLDLSNSDSVNELTRLVVNHKYDGVLLFSNVYQKQEEFDKNNFKMILNINLLNAIQLLYGLKFNKNSKIIFFSDNGISQPKRNYLAYTLSKGMMKECIRLLAVEFCESSSVIGIGLGPTLTDKSGEEAKKYYSKGLIKVDDPSLGLINFIDYILKEKNFYSTGTILKFDGGTYIKRSSA